MKKKLIFISLVLGLLLILFSTQKKFYILPKSDLSIPPGYSEEKWEGVLKECNPVEDQTPWGGGCGACFNYILEQDKQKGSISFNDISFENLDRYIDKQVTLVGYITEEPVLIKCPNRNIVIKIEVKPWLGQIIRALRSKLTF